MAFPRYAPVPLRQLEEASPSRAHGIDWATECSYRKVASNLIWKTTSEGNYLKLAPFTAARAVTLFNRFYARCSFHAVDRWHIAPACILLASKIDNSPRCAKDVATAFFVARCEKKHAHLIHKVHDPAWVQQQVALLIEAERTVLFALNFDLSIEHPTGFVLKWVKELGLSVPRDGAEARSGAEAATKTMVTGTFALISLTYQNKDALLLSATNSTRDIAAGALLLTCAACSYELPPAGGGRSFAELAEVAPDAIAEVCDRLRACFAPGTAGHSVSLDAIRAAAARRPADAAAEGAGEAPSEAAAADEVGGTASAANNGGAAAGAEEPAPAAAAGLAAAPPARGGSGESKAAAAADSPPGAHDSASSHQLLAGTALASRKRGREGGDAGGAEDVPASKQQQHSKAGFGAGLGGAPAAAAPVGPAQVQ